MPRRIPGLVRRGAIWHIDKQYRGQVIRESTGTGDRDEAERYLVRRLEQLREARVYGVREKRTFAQAADHYNETSEKRSLGSDLPHLRSVMPYIGHLPLDRVHMGTLEPWIKARREAGASAGTINRGIAVFRRILNLAARLWRDESGMTWLAEAPLLQLVSGPKVRVPHILTRDEERRLFSELPAHLAAMAEFAINTGCREREVTGLRWEWLTTRDGLTWFTLPAENTKTGRARAVMLNAIARRVVEAQKGKHTERVFTYLPRGKGATQRPVDSINGAAWRKARERAGVPASVHALRHTVATRLRDLGVPEWDVADVLGHAGGSVTRGYAWPTLERMARTVELLVERPAVGLRGIENG